MRGGLEFLILSSATTCMHAVASAASKFPRFAPKIPLGSIAEEKPFSTPSYPSVCPTGMQCPMTKKLHGRKV